MMRDLKRRLIRRAITSGRSFLPRWRERESNGVRFARDVCDLDTRSYLTSAHSQLLYDQMISKFADEVAVVKHGLQDTTKRIRPGRPLRVALSNHGLKNRGGSELWTSDVADYLVRHGADIIVYSPALGDVAKGIADATGVIVTSSVSEVRDFSPDILHVQHFSAVKPLVKAFESSSTTMVNMCHGLLPRLEIPQPNAQNYCAVSLITKAMVCFLTNAEWHTVPILSNFFDERRYHGERCDGHQPRALLFSRRATPEQVSILRDIFSASGFALDVTGMSGEVKHPEDILPRYEVVLAVGRSAIEALASGCRVILWDQGIVGPAITARNFWQCVALNFALPSGLLPFYLIEFPSARLWIKKQIEISDSDGRDIVYDATRKYLTLENFGARLHQMYLDISHGAPVLPIKADTA